MQTKRSNRKLIKFVRAFKQDNPCVDCNTFYHYAAMQFDHVGEKSANINRLMWRASIDRVQKEILMCELVCANCHAIRTYKRQHSITEGHDDEVGNA